MALHEHPHHGQIIVMPRPGVSGPWHIVSVHCVAIIQPVIGGKASLAAHPTEFL